MPADPDHIGIASVETGSYIQRLSIDRQLDVIPPLKEKDSSIIKGAVVGGDYKFDLEGKGTLPAAAAVGSNDPGIDDFSGGLTFVTDSEESEDHKDWQSWKASGESCPDAA